MTELRHVRRLAVRAPEAPAARRVAIRLEDALRIASVRSPRRVLFVRNLDLGRVPAEISSQSLSLLVERRLRELELIALRFDAPAAEHAACVWFPDRVSALVALVEALLVRGGSAAWFFARLLPGLSAHTPHDEALRLVLREALREREAPLTLVRVLSALVARGNAEPLLAMLTVQDGEALLARASPPLRPVATETSAPSEGPPPPPIDATFRALLSTWVPRWGPKDARSRFLCAIALWQARPGTLRHPDTPSVAAALSRSFVRDATAPAPRSSEPSSIRARSELHVPATALEPTPLGEETEHEQGAREPLLEARAGTHSPVASETPNQPLYTDFGGLFFTVPVLFRLGFEAFLQGHPRAWELELGRYVLLAVAERVSVTEGDPILASIAPSAEAAAAHSSLVASEPLSFELPEALRAELGEAPLSVGPRVGDERARVLSDARDLVLALARPDQEHPEAFCELEAGSGPLGHDSDFATLSHAWVCAVERWLERYTELDLTALVQRRARLTFNATHVDLFFAHRDTDVRVRRPALDIDPGWVHWLGRVLTFHYGEELDS